MKKTLLLVALLIAVPLVLFAAERVVVLEIFTSTGCGYCPAAANGAEDLNEEHSGKLLVVEYHPGAYGDPFDNPEAVARKSFYGSGIVQGYPTAIFDGVEVHVGGGGASSSNFFVYNSKYNIRANVEPPLEINLTQKINELQSTTGTLQAVITNTSGESVSGKTIFTVTESHIPYSWKGLDSLHWVERTLLPHSWGTDITLNPGANTTLTCDFTIDEGWFNFTEDENIEFGCFVQGTDKEIYQAAVIAFGDTTTEAVEEFRNLPFALKAPTVIGEQGFVELSLAAPADVDLSLYNALGNKVKSLYAGALEAGVHYIALEAGTLPRGTYFLRATAAGHNQIRKLVILH